MKAQHGFIALYALLTLAFLVAITTLVLVHWSGVVDRFRLSGGAAQAERAAMEVIDRQLIAEHVQVPRLWIPPLRGEARLADGTLVRWNRRPTDSRWKAGARPWPPEWRDLWKQLGARPEAVEGWATWMETRQSARAGIWPASGDLVSDPAYLRRLFDDLGLNARWGSADRLWSLDEGASLGRLNLLGADPEALSALSGIPAARIGEVQEALSQGVKDAAEAQSLWSFQEAQAMAPFASPHPFSEAQWVVEVHLPTLKAPIILHWRSSLDEGSAGNPWFRLQLATAERW